MKTPNGYMEIPNDCRPNREFKVISLYEGTDIELPKRETYFSAGYDLRSAETVVVGAGETVLIPTGVKAYMRDNEALFLYDRSSNPRKQGVVLINSVGVIDKDYYNNEDNEGHIQVLLKNTTATDYVVKKGDKIAQGIFQEYKRVANDFPRGPRKGGFGSTGK
jgi:dUTP pyrophosphatase